MGSWQHVVPFPFAPLLQLLSEIALRCILNVKSTDWTIFVGCVNLW